MSQGLLRNLLPVLALVLGEGSMHASVILYSNFGPVYNAYQSVNAWGVGAGSVSTRAMEFTPSTTAILDHIAVSVEVAFGSGIATLTLNTDNNNAPGNVLESWALNFRSLETYPSCCYVHALAANPGITLTGGTQYWLALSDSNSGDTVEWNFNTLGMQGEMYTLTGNQASVTSGTNGVFAVYGDPSAPSSATPEPGTFVLAAGGACLWTFVKLKSFRRT